MTSVISVDDAAKRRWDVIVVGTGMGGGLVGRRLAEHKLSVLFVEKGTLGARKEEQELSYDIANPKARRIRGFWPMQVKFAGAGKMRTFFAPLGCGVGGSSVFYAAALERPERHDLEAVAGIPHPTGGWPIGFQDFARYLEMAEKLLFARGTEIPNSELPSTLIEPPQLTQGEFELFRDLEDLGLNPYRSHEAVRGIPGCRNCLGRKCPFRCKMDGRSAGVEPALESGYAKLLADCNAQVFTEKDGRVDALHATVGDRRVVLSARQFVLAAGALHSPRMLLASGLANSSGWVGRGLMFHLNELFALWPKRGRVAAGATRAVSFRDFYTVDDNRVGMVQSMGFSADFGRIASYLKALIQSAGLSRLPGTDRIATLAAAIGSRVFGNATVFVGLVEDLAYYENRVTFDPENPDMPVVDYTISAELKARRKLFRRAVRKTFGWRRALLLGFAPDLNYGHPAGTLRFGSDPASSVLDPTCKAHDLENLYVADASFMPTSMGVNPSLTIAANALRVGDTVAALLTKPEQKAS